MGLGLLDALEAREKADLQVRYLEERLRISEGVQAWSMNAWHRQWWLVLPLGVLAGVALTITAQLALGR
jgi:sensor c-di-GMP phosphodiesterase-like protein